MLKVVADQLYSGSSCGSSQVQFELVRMKPNALNYDFPHPEKNFATAPDMAQLSEKLGDFSPHVCVCAKFCQGHVARECQKHGAVVFWDLIDNIRDIFLSYDWYGRQWIDDFNPHKEVDGYIVQTRHLQKDITEVHTFTGREKQAIVIPHQHTNTYKWGRFKPYTYQKPIKVVGILAGFKDNMPEEGQLLELAQEFCADGLNIRLRAILQALRTGQPWIQEYNCATDRWDRIMDKNHQQSKP
ncbi:hypothetical protein CYMTET_54307 [Cymbomonas tetramitiformis]|uniref:Uncharacterized protein n=1 Tax=Cymbomonas tetramitiformis TaxID=36881 RepID=A0AAE0EP56_9CHLO|nr:hypothetical protein CYMTET_54307 [Cymbomonas tetramitiformis]